MFLHRLSFPSPTCNEKETKNMNNEKLADKVRSLELLVEKQMKMIQEQQQVIGKQKCLLDTKKNENTKKFHCQSLDELIDREEDFDSEEDEERNYI